MLSLSILNGQNTYSYTFKNEISRACEMCVGVLPSFTYPMNISFHEGHSFYEQKEIDTAYSKILNFLEEGRGLSSLKLYLAYVIKARILRDKQLYPQAETELLKAIKIGKLNEYKSLPNLYGILGQLYLEQNKFEKSKNTLLEWEINFSNSNLENESVNYHNLGLALLHLGEYEISEKYLLKSYEINEIEKDTLGLARSSLDIANLYYEQYKDGEALIFFKKGLVFAKRSMDLMLLKNAYFNLAIVYENNGNLSRALHFRKEFELINDSLWNRDKIWLLAQKDKEIGLRIKEQSLQELRYKSEMQNEQLRIKKWQNKTLFFICFFVFTCLLLASFYGYKIKKQKNIIALQKENVIELNKTRDKLFSIIAHDLKTPINLLKRKLFKLYAGNSMKDKTTVAEAEVLNDCYKLSRQTHLLLDNTLHWLMNTKDKLIFKQEKLHLFSVITQVEYDYRPVLNERKMKFNCNVSKDVFVYADLNSLKVILRNILDNAVKYSSSKGIIRVNSKVNNGSCIISLIDNGMGFNTLEFDNTALGSAKKSEEKGTGLGLKLCNELTKKNQGLFQIASVPGKGTTVSITLKTYTKNENQRNTNFAY